MKFKDGVTYTMGGIGKIILVSERVYKDLGKECVITSLMDGKHMDTSKHYVGDAADLRIWFFNNAEKRIAVKQLKKELGVDFDVVLEKDHIHVEYDPKH